MARTYGQFCGLARTLDHVGDRWTLLIVRELLIGGASYGELLAALEGIPTNLLADRLRQLEEDGLVARAQDHGDRRRIRYSLTSLGAGLEPAVMALIRWGRVWMRAGPGDDRFDPRWVLLALRALLGERSRDRDGAVEVQVDGEKVTVISTAGRTLQVVRGSKADAGAFVDGSAASILGVASGELTMAEALRRGLRVRGDRALARLLLHP